jgi:malate synthase
MSTQSGSAAAPAPIVALNDFEPRLMPINLGPQSGADAQLPSGFLEFLAPLHKDFTPRQQLLLRLRHRGLHDSLSGHKPNYLPPSQATTSHWKIELPAWCADQRNQMTGPADDAELVVKMLNSGAPGVMLDLEDSTANTWEHIQRGIENIQQALRGELTYFDKKRNTNVAIKQSKTVIFTRPRGLHIHQGGVIDRELIPASLYDVARVAFQADRKQLRHPLSFYIPKSESAEEAVWWRDLFQAVARAQGLPSDAYKCMALVESHPLAYQMEEFAFNLRDHILGLNLGRWDYMASLIHFNLENPEWVLPDRNTIPHDVPFFQNLRELMPALCHRRGMLAIGGMTALYPSRENPELNERALKILAEDKKNESNCGMDGAWTGHPDQNQVAVDQFPVPNQIDARPRTANTHPDLRPIPRGVGEQVGKRTVDGTRAAVRTVIRYRNGVLHGRGASLLDGYMEDLATDRIYRLMISQRMKHSARVEILDDAGRSALHTREFISGLFDEELQRLLTDLRSSANGDADSPQTAHSAQKLREARRLSEQMILHGEFTPA